MLNVISVALAVVFTCTLQPMSQAHARPSGRAPASAIPPVEKVQLSKLRPSWAVKAQNAPMNREIFRFKPPAVSGAKYSVKGNGAPAIPNEYFWTP